MEIHCKLIAQSNRSDSEILTVMSEKPSIICKAHHFCAGRNEYIKKFYEN